MSTLAERLRVSTPERSTYPGTRRTRPAWARAAHTVADRLRRAGLGTSREIVVGRHTGARC
jgi:hypothetical protein